MAQLFEDERKYPDNKTRQNLVFLGHPYKPPIALEDYRKVVRDLERRFPIRLWYFLDEITTAEMMRKIWRAILRCDLAVFDISGGNPNVAFELGLAVAQNKNCITVLKTGEANPLGSADLGYAERAEYQSVESLRTQLEKILHAKSSALRIARDLSFSIHDGAMPFTRDEVEAGILDVLSTVFTAKRISKSTAAKLFTSKKLADVALARLREKDVLTVIGQKRGARWVFTDSWVHHDHEVSGA